MLTLSNIYDPRCEKKKRFLATMDSNRHVQQQQLASDDFGYFDAILTLCFWCRCSSSSMCLGKAALFSCCTPWAFHITILDIKTREIILSAKSKGKGTDQQLIHDFVTFSQLNYHGIIHAL